MSGVLAALGMIGLLMVLFRRMGGFSFLECFAVGVGIGACFLQSLQYFAGTP